MRPQIATIALGPLLLFVGGCSDGGTPLDSSLAGPMRCLAAGERRLDAGEVVRLGGEAAGAACVAAGPVAAEYLYVPFFASGNGSARLAVELTATGIAGSGSAVLLPREGARAQADTARPDDGFHLRLRLREIRELTPRMPLARAGRRSRSATVPAPGAAAAVGDLVTLNTTAECDRVERRTGRVEAVTRTAIVVADTANPAGGFTAEDWRFFGEAFDTLVDPVAVANFGEPSDIDGNGRVIIFFTRAVNDLTAEGSGSFVGGFFWGGDLFPDGACRGSNRAEIFYLLVPDPARADRGERVFEPAYVRRIAVGILAHEYQHLINAARRIYGNDADSFEEVWLNEGLSHIAEELLFYHATGLHPRMNLDLETVLATPQRRQAFAAYAAPNLGRFREYLRDPEQETLFGIDNLPTRVASWAFLRYLADQDEGPDAPLFLALVNGREAGVANLASALDANPLDLAQAWTVSVFTDDAVPGAEARYAQPSWNFRSVTAAFTGQSPAEFPLRVITAEPGVTTTLTLQGGGAAFVRFRLPAGGRALLRTGSGGGRPPEALRLSLVRIR